MSRKLGICTGRKYHTRMHMHIHIQSVEGGGEKKVATSNAKMTAQENRGNAGSHEVRNACSFTL